jgi:lysophospholipid acyltransferase (LPLAT)-like uncharacterized protein
VNHPAPAVARDAAARAVIGDGGWRDRAVIALGAALVLALGRTWRLDIDDPFRSAPGAGRGAIFAVWHARLLPTIYRHRGAGAVALVSRSRDGALISGVIERLGFATVRGSSSRGGDEALRLLLARARGTTELAVTPDGPRGPAEAVKPGLVWLASRSGAPVVPVAAAARGAWRMRSWDRFMVPRPFARVRIAYGAPLHVPPGLEGDALEPWRARIEATLRELTRAADRAVGLAPGAAPEPSA